MPPTRTSRLRLWGPVAIYMAVLFALSAQPVLPSPPGLKDKTNHLTGSAALPRVTLRPTRGGTRAGVTMKAAAGAGPIAPP